MFLIKYCSYDKISILCYRANNITNKFDNWVFVGVHLPEYFKDQQNNREAWYRG